MSSLQSRVVIIDIAKGILILLVVLGHTSFTYSKYIFWFHMPAFFIISGMLLPNRSEINAFTLEQFKKRVVKFFLPYTSYFILITLVSFFFIQDKIEAKLFLRFIWGGRLLVGVYGTFWFITCLFICQYLFLFIQKLHLRVIYIVFVLVIFYYASVYVSNLLDVKYVPLNADIALIAVSYLFIGYFFKSRFMLESTRLTWSSVTLILALIVILIFIDTTHPGFYTLNMKYGVFNNPILDLLIPIVFLIGIMFLSLGLSFNRFAVDILSLCGRNSLHIMYLHLLIFSLLKNVGIDSVLIHLLLGSIVPVAIGVIFKYNYVSNLLFHGTSLKR